MVDEIAKITANRAKIIAESLIEMMDLAKETDAPIGFVAGSIWQMMHALTICMKSSGISEEHAKDCADKIGEVVAEMELMHSGKLPN